MIEEKWKEVDRLISIGNYEQTAPLLNEIKTYAKKSKNGPMELRAIIAESQLLQVNTTQEDLFDKVDKHFQNNINQTEGVQRSLLYSFYAQYLGSNTDYYSESKNKFLEADEETKYKILDSLFNKSLENKDLLLKQPIEDWKSLFSTSKNFSLSPTLYHFNSNAYLAFLRGNRVKNAVKIKKLSEDLFSINKKAGYADATSYLMVNNISPSYQKKDAYVDALKNVIAQNKSDYNAFIYAIIAETLHNNNDTKKAVEYLAKAKQEYPKSPWIKDVELMDQRFKSVEIQFYNKQINPSNVNSPVQLSFKNAEKLYLKVFNVTNTPTNYKKFEVKLDSLTKKVGVNATEVYAEEIPIKSFDDYKRHSTIYKINALPFGNYVALISNNPEFKADGLFNTVSSFSFIVSDLFNYTELEKGKNTEEYLFKGLLINRKTGLPYAGKSLEIYDVNSGKAPKLVHKMKTNQNGEFSVDINKDSYYRYQSGAMLYLAEEKQIIDMATPLNYSFSQIEKEEDRERFNTKILTDRRIYRPGQKLYFKGIVYNNSSLSGKVIEGKKLDVILQDANGQKVDSLSLTSNAFGSVNGELQIPANTLAGGFNILIMDKGIQIGYHYLSVEEYKRPTFSVKFDPNKETYKRSDIAEFKGKVESYSGVPLVGASVNYKVRINSYGRNYTNFTLADSSIIANEQGKFSIRIPLEDTALNKLEDFNISVTAEVVNQTGEMQQASVFYTYSDKPWVINILGPRIEEAGKWNKLFISTVNKNNQPLPLTGEIKIYKYPEPNIALPDQFDNIFKNVDYHIFSNAEYKKLFPTSFDESLIIKKPSELVKTYSFDTWDTGLVKIDSNLFPKGKYYVEVISIQGKDTIRSQADVSIFDPVTKKSSDHDFLTYSFDKPNYGLDEQVKLNFYTDVPNAKEIILFPSNSFGKQETFTIPVKNGRATHEFKFDKEKFSRGYQLDAILIVDNQIENKFISAPKRTDDQDLKIKISSFRDKIMPATKEKWSFSILQKDKVIPSEVLATMYDMSLDVFGANYFPTFFDRYSPSYYRRYNFTNLFYASSASSPFGSNEQIINAVGNELPLVNNYGLWDNYWLNRGVNNLNNYYGDPVLNRVGSALAVKGMQRMAKNTTSAVNLEAAADVHEVTEETVLLYDELKDPDLRAQVEELKNKGQGVDLSQVQARKNLQETAFFYPNLYTDKDGNISFEFDSPEALTKWKLLLFAHGKNLEVGSEQFYTQTQKQLMVRPNLPRYFRESDQIEIIAQVQNLSGKPQQGKAKIEVINPVDNADISEQFVLGDITTDFSVDKDNNQTVSWKLKVPEGYPSVQVKIVAASAEHSDGEIIELPVLSNKVLVSQTEKIALKAGQKQDFSVASAGKDNLQAKVQVQSNPILEIISAIDYLKNYPYECTEQSSSKWFGLKMVQYIGKHYPAISDYFRSIKVKDSKSRLEENAQLNELKLQEMPWLRDIQHDSKRLEALAELFNSDIETELKGIEQKLLRGQLDNGSFPWFEGGKSDTHISMRILEVVGKVFYLDHSLVNPQMNGSMRRLSTYLDQDSSITREKASANIALDYLYARHFWNSEVKVPQKNGNILRTKIAKAPIITAKGPAGYAAKAWIVNQLFGDSKESNEIRNRIQQEVILDPDKGMYWESNGKQYNDISLHSYMLEAYKLHDPSKLNPISQWIFFRKEANYWRSTWMTVDAIYSLLLTNNPKDFNLDNAVTVLVDGQKAQMDSVVLGQVSKTFGKQELDRNRSVQIENHNDRIVFGGVFHQYFLPVSEVKASTNDIKVSKQYMVERNGKWVESNEAKLGEKIKVVITVINDQDLEYVHLKDSRPAGVEPVFVPSGYSWRNNYYFTLKDASTNYFFNALQKGKRTFEYEVKANNLGEFNSGITSIESMYDPTVNARSDNKVITIVK
ncbi:alpha-2-macroglobulin family protein [Sphingobacterium sp.]|uniref:alpha-2-macroglobulin family protein n=1 Tax=Sphingobacterium sp. TaxID=341027 RepID=UPI0028AA6483|nr:alpha-2-macroglobulin family protein [Sphingobacterium sp.]